VEGGTCHSDRRKRTTHPKTITAEKEDDSFPEPSAFDFVMVLVVTFTIL
jgi:hypothetical protein